jgi:hypothetical protein
MSSKQRELVILGLVSALASTMAWKMDYLFECFILGWLVCGILLLLMALIKFGDDAYE